jgi:hypothetical protein
LLFLGCHLKIWHHGIILFQGQQMLGKIWTVLGRGRICQGPSVVPEVWSQPQSSGMKPAPSQWNEASPKAEGWSQSQSSVTLIIGSAAGVNLSCHHIYQAWTPKSFVSKDNLKTVYMTTPRISLKATTTAAIRVIPTSKRGMRKAKGHQEICSPLQVYLQHWGSHLEHQCNNEFLLYRLKNLEMSATAALKLKLCFNLNISFGSYSCLWWCPFWFFSVTQYIWL